MDIAKISHNILGIVALLALAACGGGGGGGGGDGGSNQDRVGPIITVSGDNTIYHEQGTAYVDAGAVANDAVDGTVSVTTDNQVGTAAGTYSVTYSAQDRSGNTATKVRTVIVADTICPNITLTGATSVTHQQGTTYIDAGASANDIIDGTLTPILSGSVGGDVGVYTLTYTATDVAGNSGTAIRTVTVSATTNGDAANIVVSNGAAGSVWDLGIQAFDQYLNWGSCANDGGDDCASLNWSVETDDSRGDVLQVSYAANAQHAGIYFQSSTAQDLSAYASGAFVFDIKVIDDGTDNLSHSFQIKMESGSDASAELYVNSVADSAITANGQWQTISIPMSNFTASTFDLSATTTAMSFFPEYQTGANLVYQLDNARFELGSGNSGGGSCNNNGNDNASAINSDNWFHQTILPNGNAWFNQEQQHYTNRIENSYVSNGTLKIVAKKETFTDQSRTKQYTSARLNSKFAFTYGYVEIRAKLPSGVGTWPAIWTLGKNINETGAYWQTQGFGTTSWPACGEIDIMEHWGSEQNTVQSAMHTPSSSGATENKGSQYISTASTAFHIYSMEWSADKIVFKVDGNQHYTYEPIVKNADTWPFDQPQYLLMNFAIKDDIASSFSEGQMEVDYVRIYNIDANPLTDDPIWSDEFN